MQIFPSLEHLEQLYVAIIAGGQGTRLFPLSHSKRPKQFCQMDKDNTFIQATVRRFADLGIGPERFVIVTTNPNQTKLANEQLNGLGVTPQNVLEISPTFGYAGAMVKAAEFIRGLDADATIINTPADQYIVANDDFRAAMWRAIESAENGSPALIGVTVKDDLNTVMGCGHAIFDLAEPGECKSVLGFVEKPKETEAEALMAGGNSACNTGINVWKARDVLAASAELSLETELATDTLMNALNALSGLKVAFGQFAWFDCGTLKSLYDIGDKTAEGNVLLGEGKIHGAEESCQRSLLIAERGIEMHVSGIKDSAVVASVVDGRMIVAVVKLERSQRMRELVEKYNNHDGDLLGKIFMLGGARYIHVAQDPTNDEITAMAIGVQRYVITQKKTAGGNTAIYVAKEMAA